LRTDVQPVFAIPTTKVDHAIVQLAATLTAGGLAVMLLVGLVIWWVYRLGLRPFADLTAAARAITRGERRRRVDPGPPGPEANELAQAFNTMPDAKVDLGAVLRDAADDVRGAGIRAATPVRPVLPSRSRTWPRKRGELSRAGDRGGHRHRPSGPVRRDVGSRTGQYILVRTAEELRIHSQLSLSEP